VTPLPFSYSLKKIVKAKRKNINNESYLSIRLDGIPEEDNKIGGLLEIGGEEGIGGESVLGKTLGSISFNVDEREPDFLSHLQKLKL
jgi:hypothetical protein